jgi:hypothetical protein
MLLSISVHPAMLVLSFFCVRLLCLGGLMMWATVPISQWFIRKRGRVQSYLIVCSTLFTSVLVFPAWQRLIQLEGWRLAARIAGCAMGSMALPSALLIYSTPELVGCVPDERAVAASRSSYAPLSREEEELVGEEEQEEQKPEPELPKVSAGSAGSAGSARRPEERRSFTLRQAVRTPAFYIICFDSMSGCILGAGIFFHLIP